MKKIQLNIFNQDFKDFISALNAAKVDYILVGGYSVILHGYSRTIGDLSIWFRKTEDNINLNMVVTLLTERTRADFSIETVRVEWSPKRTQKIKTLFTQRPRRI